MGLWECHSQRSWLLEGPGGPGQLTMGRGCQLGACLRMVLHQHLDLDLTVTSGLIWPVASSWGDWNPSVTSTQLTAVFEPCATATLSMCVFIDIPTWVCVCTICTWMFLCACSLLSTMLSLTAHWTWGHEDVTDSAPSDHQTDNS